MNTHEFLLWEMRSRDTIDVKRCYVDIAGDLVSGVLLSQIIFWHLPDEQGNSKLKVHHEGYEWLAKKRDDWWNECRITPKQFDRASEVLEKKELIVTHLYRFGGSPTKHIRMNWDSFFDALKTLEDNDFPQRSKSKFPKGENGNSPKVKMEIDEKGKTYTKNTAKITSSPLTPQGEEHEPACEDVASLGGSTSTQEEEREINPVCVEEQPPQPARVSETLGSESKSRVSARDNKSINPADPFYAGVIKTITKQAEKNIRASAPRRNFYRDNCWGELAIAYNFDPKKAYELLEKWIAAKAKRKDDPIGYAQAILRKWSEVEGSEDASTYWQEFKGIVQRKGFAGVEEALQPPPDRIEPTTAMSPEQEAWVGIMSQIEYVSGFVQVDIKENPSFGGWHVRTNISIPGWNVQGALSEVVRKFPLSKVRERFPEFYPECYRLAKQKFPHLILLEPISQSSSVG